MPVLIRIPGDKRTFAAGLYWRHEDRKPSRKDLLAGARGSDFWVAQRRTKNRSLQSGFCRPLLQKDLLGNSAPSDKPYKGRVYSLAAAVADVLQEPWLGIFDIGEGLYWYIAVRDSYEILPDGDAVGDRYAIEDLRRQHAAYGEPTVFRDGNLDDIALLLRQGPKVSPLSDVRKNPMKPLIIAAVSASTVAGGGVFLWHEHEARVEHEALLAQEKRIAMLRAMQERKTAHVALPWSLQPLPSQVLRGCLHAVQSLPLSDKGWSLSRVRCSVNGSRLGTQVLWDWEPGATALDRPDGELTGLGKKVVQTLTPVLLPPSHAQGILPQAQAQNRLYGLGQALGISVKLMPPSHPEPAGMPGAKPTAPKPASPWAKLPVSLSGTLPQWGQETVWDSVPALRLDSLLVEPGKTGTVRVSAQGTLYVPSISVIPPRPSAAVRPETAPNERPTRLAPDRSVGPGYRPEEPSVTPLPSRLPGG